MGLAPPGRMGWSDERGEDDPKGSAGDGNKPKNTYCFLRISHRGTLVVVCGVTSNYSLDQLAGTPSLMEGHVNLFFFAGKMLGV